MKRLTAWLNQKWVNRRFPIAFKWTATVGLSLFIIFATLASVLFSATKQILLTQEQRLVRETMTIVTQRLAMLDGPLQTAQVVEQLERGSEYAPNDSSQPDNYHDEVFEKLARADLSIAVFDPTGAKLFSSRDNDRPFAASEQAHVQYQDSSAFTGIVGRTPLKNSRGRLIGYAQVTDQIQAVQSTLRQTLSWVVGLSIVALVVALALGYLMARQLLKPIKAITNTIDVVNEEPQSSMRITDQRRHDELGDLVNAFNDMLDRIQHFIDQQSDFVQDVSHELRTPVAILEGHLQLLNRWGKDDPEVLAESLGASLQEVTRMKSLIQEMLDLTRADQVDVQFANAVVEVDQVIKQVVNDMQMIHPEFAIILDDDLTGDTYVRMYRNHLEQVLIILMDNAVKYTKARKEIHVSAAEDSEGVAIAIQDFGEGISEKDRERVFNRFYRVDKARSREKGGNGLGLSIAQQLIEGYNGRIQVDSVLGSGSVFRIDLPVITAEKAASLRAQQPKAAPEADPLANSQL